ncbi:nitrous oxide reductase family maturation protein NosD [Cognaticolwellia beringensis]|uniref:Copper-binding protein n=1 Tax=Cognaticolwellia beringensis TaxID=1967665 RepID=A0A222G6I1_9GAMM|nr:nitrous oxide reductase family maturation protein NosD [Cognaticolwellia beringensis]ASP47495.1 copper-binding protein [Cognaticolwellia beringensis]
MKLLLFKILSILVLSLIAQHSILAATIEVSPADNLQQTLDNSVDGDIIILAPGRYLGNFVVKHRVTLRSIGIKPTAVIDAQGQGHALVLEQSNIVLENLTIVNWGHDLTEQDSGIYAVINATNITIKGNHLKGDGFGIWLQKAKNIKVLANVIQGNIALRSADRGNGIQLSIVQDVAVKNNEIFHTRDGLYIISSQNNVLENNTMRDLRYGVHFMYSHSNNVLNNKAYNTRAGYALMSSRNLIVDGNLTENSEDYGFLMNFITSSTISNNDVKSVWTKPKNKVLGRDGKGFFVYNSAYNTIKNNRIDTAEIGIHLTAGSENTKVYGNSFINNPIQVKYVSNKKQEWSFEGKGNYWSNYLGWDMNGDNIGDVIFEPNDGIDQLIWRYPEMKMLMDSPVVLILRWIQKEFPVLKPPGVKDSFPLMRSPTNPLIEDATLSVVQRANMKTALLEKEAYTL